MRWALFLRAVNVGGTGKLAMAKLRAALEAEGARDVATYIQSGNVVLEHAADDPDSLARWAEGVLTQRFRLETAVAVRDTAALDAAIGAHPWAATGAGNQVHFAFFSGAAQADAAERLARCCTNGEEVRADARALYLYTPNGIGRSKLNGQLDRAVGRPVTVRNLNTLRKVRDML